MSHYTAEILWSRGEQAFVDNKYSRAHRWVFDGGLEVPASSSPSVVPLPFSVPGAVDPEEAFVASLSSCHMLWFLSLAAGRGHCVDLYEDKASGVMGRNAEGHVAMLKVTLSPWVRFSGDTRPSEEEVRQLHELAHDKCYIAHSVRTEVVCEPRFESLDR